MDRLLKRICLFLVASLALSLTACAMKGSNGAENENTAYSIEKAAAQDPSAITSKNSKSKELKYEEGSAPIYSKERIELPGDYAAIYKIAQSGEKIFAYGVDASENSVFYLLNPEDSTAEILPLEADDSLLLLGSGPENVQAIVTLNEAGEYILSIYENTQLSEQVTITLPEEYESDAINSLTVYSDHTIVALSHEIVAFSRSGEFEKSLGAYNASAGCFTNADGNLLVVKDETASEAKTTVTVYDEELEPISAYAYSEAFEGFSYVVKSNIFVAVKSGIVFSFDYINGTVKGIIDAASSGMGSGAVLYGGAEKFVTLERGVPTLWSVRDDTQTAVLTLAAYSLNPEIEDLVNAYNEYSQNVKIKVVDYAVYDSAEGDETGLLRLRTELLAGNTPDLYDLSNLAVYDLINNGFLTDLTPFFKENTEVKLTDLFDNAVQLLKQDEKIYYIMPSFYLMSTVGSKELLDGEEHLSSERFFEAAENMPASAVFGSEMTRTDFLIYLLLFNSKSYYDRSSGDVHFTDSDFEQYLEFAALLPEEIDYNEIASQDLARACAGEQMLIFSHVGGNIVSMFAYYDAAFGGKAEHIGFPTTASAGIAFEPTALVGIAADSSWKDKATDFIDFMLSDYAQTSELVYGLPINEKALAQRLDLWASRYETNPKAMVSVYDGARIEITGSISAQEAEKAVYNALNKADTLAIIDNTLLQLIISECQPYFHGQTTAAQTTANIQSKVKLYLSEQG